jgi:hypothetical protein
MDKRKEIVAEDPKLPFGEVTKKVSACWADASEADKKKYEDLSKKDKERYTKEKEEYDAKQAKKDE